MTTIRQEKTQKGITVQSDAGYGDGDVIADITYAVWSVECPKCKELIPHDKKQIAETNRRYRH